MERAPSVARRCRHCLRRRPRRRAGSLLLLLVLSPVFLLLVLLLVLDMIYFSPFDGSGALHAAVPEREPWMQLLLCVSPGLKKCIHCK